MQRRLEFVSGSSAKFYQVAVYDARVEIRYGRLGTMGQLQVKVLTDNAAAHAQASKLIRQKLAKGYVECSVV